MPTARELEDLWRAKSDDELLEAAAQLGEYTPDGQKVIRAELMRRGFEDPMDQRGEAGGAATVEAAPPRDCLRCHAEMRFVGTRGVDRAGWIATGEMREAVTDGAAFDLYVCPECAHVEMFLNLPAEEEEEETEDESGPTKA
jgi:hypothetical protein